jgi:DNA-binding response OmpR family regulator
MTDLQLGGRRGHAHPTRILLVEDERLLCDLKARLEKAHYHVEGPVSTGELVVEMAVRTHPDLVLRDLRLGGAMDGVAAYCKRQRRNLRPRQEYGSLQLSDQTHTFRPTAMRNRSFASPS